MFWQPCNFVIHNFVDIFFILLHSIIIISVFVCWAFLPEYFETINCWNIGKWPFFWIQIRICFKQNVRKTETEIRAIDIEVFLPWNVNFLASWAICLYLKKMKKVKNEILKGKKWCLFDLPLLYSCSILRWDLLAKPVNDHTVSFGMSRKFLGHIFHASW